MPLLKRAVVGGTLSTSDEARFRRIVYAPKCINIATFLIIVMLFFQNVCVNFGVLLEKEMRVCTQVV